MTGGGAARASAWLWRSIEALLAASLQQMVEVPACFAAGGLLARRERGDAVGLFDLGCAAVALGGVAWLVRQVSQVA